MMLAFSLPAPWQKNQVQYLDFCDECQILIATGVGKYPGHLSLLGGLLIMDTAVEEDTEEERKMPLAIMQGYMTIIQVNNFKSQGCEEIY